MDVLLGITTGDAVILATSKAAMRGISVLKSDDDKTRNLTSTSSLAFSGEAGDAVQFAEYILANISLYGMRNGYEMSSTAIASYLRNEMANSLRSRKPYQVNMLLGSYDVRKEKPSLYWIDYLASGVELPYAAHGYASYYILSLLDRHHRPGLTLEEGLDLMKLCVDEIKRRIPLDFKGIQIKIIDKNGVRLSDDL
ncbi:uncharacterized protein SAPINGB_P004219 [Magnusiomyces paraingens]|uniref:Proteasome subunit beta n=1 Tax=Magnusiomyces paraingens TaxID=2606893 RepID=A0A5E8BTE2_9ASCO|nr:uncharacterized protein SAPINGB_P004219 [Saprochaete ingens]VVT54723.1 unnamed protein product [Saprochaete ingens]